MAVPRQLVTVPATGGISTEVDRRLRPPERLEIARNVRYDEIGGLGKRYGFSKLSTRNLVGTSEAIDDKGPVRGLARTSKELLAIGHRDLYAWNPKAAGWLERGGISPCAGRTTELHSSMAEYDYADLDVTLNGYIVSAAVRWELRGDDPSYTALEFRIHTEDGDALMQPQLEEELTNPAHRPRYVGTRVIGLEGEAVILFGDRDHATNDMGLKSYRYPTGTPATAPVAGTLYTADVFNEGSAPFSRTYDGCYNSASAEYLVAWVSHSANEINLRTFSILHVLQNSETIDKINAGEGENEEKWIRVAVNASADGNYYVIAVAQIVGDGRHKVYLYKYTSGLTSSWSEKLLYGPGTAQENVDNVGVCHGENNQGIERALGSWVVHDTSGSLPERVLHARSARDADGLALSTVRTSANLLGVSRPFYYRGLAYQYTMSSARNYHENYGYQTHMLVELGDGNQEGGLTGASIRLMAIWGVGQAPGAFDDYFTCGSLSPVGVGADDSTLRYCVCPFLAEALQPAGSAINNRITWRQVRLQFDAPVLATPVFRGHAIIGGGFVAYYDGAHCYELGFAVPPFPEVDDGGSGSQPLAGDHTYYPHWAQMSGGVLHRSVPGPPVTHTLSGAENITLNATSYPQTRRVLNDMSCEWYRVSSTLDSIARRVNRSEENIPNAITTTIPTFTDSSPDGNLTPVLYTTGGVLEAVCPEGARIPFLVRERVVLGGFFGGDRIQFSQQITPSTAGETVVAPEFIEPLGRLVERGEELTGVSVLDTATVVCTTGSIYLIGGQGPNRQGQGDDMGRLTKIPVDDGCHEIRSVIDFPEGVMYATARGIYALTRGQGIEPIGEPVRDLTDAYPVITSAVVVPKERQVRFTCTNASETDGRVLVYDYRVGAWFEWELRADASNTVVPVGATFVDDTYYVTDSTGQVWYEDEDTNYDSGSLYVTQRIELGEMQSAGPQAWLRCGKVSVLMSRADKHGVKMYLAHDYADTPGTAAAEWTSAEVEALRDAADREQLQLRPAQQKGQSFRLRIEDTDDGSHTTGAGFIFHAATFELGVYERGARIESQGRA